MKKIICVRALCWYASAVIFYHSLLKVSQKSVGSKSMGTLLYIWASAAIILRSLCLVLFFLPISALRTKTQHGKHIRNIDVNSCRWMFDLFHSLSSTTLVIRDYFKSYYLADMLFSYFSARLEKEGTTNISRYKLLKLAQKLEKKGIDSLLVITK